MQRLPALPELSDRTAWTLERVFDVDWMGLLVREVLRERTPALIAESCAWAVGLSDRPHLRRRAGCRSPPGPPSASGPRAGCRSAATTAAGWTWATRSPAASRTR